MDTVKVLSSIPTTDVNFKSALNNAREEDLNEAICIMEEDVKGKHKSRLTVCKRMLEKLRKEKEIEVKIKSQPTRRADGTEYAELIAEGLVKHCKKWDYDWIEKFRKNPTIQNFHAVFCKSTRTYFMQFCENENHRDIEFTTDNTIMVKECGPDYDKRDPDTILPLSAVISKLTMEQMPKSRKTVRNKDVLAQYQLPLF